MTVAAEHDVPDPLHAAHAGLLPGARLRARIAGRTTPRCRSRRWPSRWPQSRVALITTAAPYQPGVGDQGPGAKYNAAAKFYKVYSDSTETIPDLRISHVGYDRKHTTADDPHTWLPLAALQQAVKAGRIGALTPRFHGAPTNRSQRVTTETDAPELLERCREDGAEVAVLVPS